ncbi:MAG: hypothetical protein DDT20_00945 [Firmicutes bacterium]|nr:hypothetical protein [Bacillota bacterium]
MSPSGRRHFPTAQMAYDAAVLLGLRSFVIIRQGRNFTSEFAYIAPVEFFMTRGLAARAAGIDIVKVVQ